MNTSFFTENITRGEVNVTYLNLILLFKGCPSYFSKNTSFLLKRFILLI